MDESLSTRGKFAIAMIILVILVAVGLRVYWYFNPNHIESIFVEDTLDFEAIEEELFGDDATFTNIVESNTTAVVSERSSTQAIQWLGTQQLQLGQDVTAAQLGDRYIIGFSRGGEYHIQAYDRQWQVITDASAMIDTTPALQRQLLAMNNQLYLLSTRATASGTQLDLIHISGDFSILSTTTVLENREDTMQFKAVAMPGQIDLAFNTQNQAVTIVRFSYSGELINEQSLGTLGEVLNLYEDQAQHLILVTVQAGSVQFTKFDEALENTASFSISIENEGYILQNFARLGDYIILVGSGNVVANQYAQVWAWSDNLVTQYPSVHLTYQLKSPQVLVRDNQAFVVYGVSETTVTDNIETTVHSIQVDQFASQNVTNLPDESLQ